MRKWPDDTGDTRLSVSTSAAERPCTEMNLNLNLNLNVTCGPNFGLVSRRSVCTFNRCDALSLCRNRPHA